MISICMIVKNEEKVLEKCLEHLVPYGYEIIIVDTGSTDKTKEIALKYTDKVFDYIWKRDFSDARNYSISKASNNYVLVIDSDEIVTSLDKYKLEKLIVENPKSIGRLLRINEYKRGEEYYSGRERVSRLFLKSDFKYEGIIHEQIVHRGRLENTFYNIPIEMRHSGYEGDIKVRKKKTERNIELLKKQLETNGEDPYVLYQLGKSYYMNEDYNIACDYFGKALCYNLDTDLEYVQELVESYGYSLLESKQYTASMQLLNVYDEFAVNADFIFLIALILMNNAKFNEAISEFTKATRMKEYKIDGVNSYRAFYNIGVIYECLGELQKAKNYYNKCGNYNLAKDRLDCII